MFQNVLNFVPFTYRTDRTYTSREQSEAFLDMGIFTRNFGPIGFVIPIGLIRINLMTYSILKPAFPSSLHSPGPSPSSRIPPIRTRISLSVGCPMAAVIRRA
jgi:hypothetical protein